MKTFIVTQKGGKKIKREVREREREKDRREIKREREKYRRERRKRKTEERFCENVMKTGICWKF